MSAGFLIILLIIIFLFTLWAGWWLILEANLPASFQDKPQSTKQKRVQMILKIITGIYAIILLPACLFGFLAPLVFLGQNSKSLLNKFMEFLGMATLPLTIVCSVAIAWILYKRKNFVIALLMALPPIIHFVISYVMPILLSAPY